MSDLIEVSLYLFSSISEVYALWLWGVLNRSHWKGGRAPASSQGLAWNAVSQQVRQVGARHIPGWWWRQFVGGSSRRAHQVDWAACATQKPSVVSVWRQPNRRGRSWYVLLKSSIHFLGIDVGAWLRRLIRRRECVLDVTLDGLVIAGHSVHVIGFKVGFRRSTWKMYWRCHKTWRLYSTAVIATWSA